MTTNQINVYQHLLWACDLSEDAEHIGARAADIAQRYSARLSVVHVVGYMPPIEIGGEFALPPYPEIEQLLVKQATERLAALAEKFHVPKPAQLIRVGSPRAEIIYTAQTNEIDLIIVGRHRRRGLGVLLGSTANGVLQSATCDVLAVRV